MNPLNDDWIYRYRQMDNVVASALQGYDWKNNWLGAWNLMKDFQNTSVCKSSNQISTNDMR